MRDPVNGEPAYVRLASGGCCLTESLLHSRAVEYFAFMFLPDISLSDTGKGLQSLFRGTLHSKNIHTLLAFIKVNLYCRDLYEVRLSIY